MGSTLLALTPSEILSISNDTFLDVVAEISEIQGFTTQQLQAWATMAIRSMGGPAMMTEDQLLSLNEFAKGFTADELSEMSFTSNEVIESFGNIRGYTSLQITKLWETIKGGKSMAAFTGDDLVALGVIATGMSTAELNGIDALAYQDAALELGQLNEWSSEQLAALKEKAILSFGAVNSWTPAQMSLAGAVIGSFTVQEVQSISADQLDAVASNSLQHIPPNIFKAFSLEQLSNMSGEQAAAVTDEQKSVLSSAQKTILMGIETATLGYTSGGAASGLSMSPLIVHTVVFQVFMAQYISLEL